MNLLAQKLTLPGSTSPVKGPITIPGTSDITIGALLSQAIPFIFAFAGLGLLFMIMASGFGLMTSAGDAKKMEKAKQQLTYAIVGFLVIFAAYWMVQIFGTIFGLDVFGKIFK